MRARSLTLAALATLAVASGCSTGELVDGHNPGARSVVLVLDTSDSMRVTDPSHTDVVGASLALGLASRGENFGALSMGSLAKVVSRLGAAGDAGSRASVRSRLASMARAGSTDFEAALEKGRAMLDEAQAARGSSLVVLTDGFPTAPVARGGSGSARRLSAPRASIALAERGWRIFAIAIGDEARRSRDVLTRIVAPTGGAVFEADSVPALLAAFQDVSVQALGYLAAFPISAQDELVVPAGTRRLAVVSRFDTEGPGARLVRDGQTLDTSRVLALTPAGPLSVALVEDPEPGTYKFDLGGATETRALLDLGWTPELHVPFEVDSGAPVPVEVTFQGTRPADATVEVALRRGERGLAQARLSLEGERFTGAVTAPSDLEPITIVARVTVLVGERRLTAERKSSVSLRPATAPPPAPRLVVPASLELEAFDDEPARGTIRVEGDATLVRAPPEVRVVKVKGGYDVEVAARSKGGTVSLGPRECRVSVTRVVFDLTKPIDLGRVAPGAEARATIEGSGGALAVEGLAKLDSKLEQRTLVVRAPAAAGKYDGAIVARAGQSTRRVKVSLEVLPAFRVPEKLDLAGSFGWLTKAFEVTSSDTPEVSVAAFTHEGGTTIAPGDDLRVEPRGESRFELRLRGKASLPAGRYTGAIDVRAGEARRSIPVTVTLTRTPEPLDPEPGVVAALAKAIAGPPGRAVSVVVDRSASLALADPQGGARRTLAVALAASLGPFDALVIGDERVSPRNHAAFATALRTLAATEPLSAPGFDVLRAIELASAKGSLVVLLTADELESPAPVTPRKVVALRAPLPDAARSAPFLESLGATIVDVRTPDVVSTRTIGGDGKVSLGPARSVVVANRAVKLAGEPLDVAGRLWIGSGDVEGEPGTSLLVLVPPAGDVHLVARAFTLASGETLVRVTVTPASIALRARSGDVDVALEPRDGVFSGRLRATGPILLTPRLGEVDLDATEVKAERASIVVHHSGALTQGTSVALDARPAGFPPELLPAKLSLVLRSGTNEITVDLARSGDAFSGTFVPATAGRHELVRAEAGEVLAVELAPFEVAPAPVIAKPPAPVVEPDPSDRWRKIVGAALAIVAVLSIPVIVVLRRRGRTSPWGMKQLRGIANNGKISYERYLLRECLESRTVATAPPGDATGVRLELREKGVHARALEGSHLALIDVPDVHVGELDLRHLMPFFVVRGLYVRRYAFLEREPSADELLKRLAPDTESYDNQETHDSDVFVLLDERQNLIPPSSRIVAIESARLPEIRPVLDVGSDENIIITDSDEEKLLDAKSRRAPKVLQPGESSSDSPADSGSKASDSDAPGNSDAAGSDEESA